MPLNLCNYDSKAREAIKSFWQTRDNARRRHEESGKADQGERSGVIGGKNMDGFSQLVIDLVKANGLPNAQIHQRRAALALPGYFRPTKLWDLLVTDRGRLIAALEFKSHVGPSFGNNFNNRTEEAIGTSHDLVKAYREGAFGEQEHPFVGWLILVEDAPKSRSPVKDRSLHFPVFPEFTGASYLKRYDLLCQKLVKEQLYTSASVIASSRSAVADGVYTELSPMTGLRSFVASLAGHIASAAVR